MLKFHRIMPILRSKGSERPATFGQTTQDGVPVLGGAIDHQGNLWTVTTRPKVVKGYSNPGIGLQATYTTGQFGSDRGQTDYLMARYIGGAAPTVQTLQLLDAGGVIWSAPMLAPIKGVDQIIMPLCQLLSGTHVAQTFTLQFAAAPAADEYQMIYIEAHDPGIG